MKNRVNQLHSEGFMNLTFVISFCISFGILLHMIGIVHSWGIDTSSSRYNLSGFPIEISGLKQNISVRLSVSWTTKQYPWLFVLRKTKIGIPSRYVFHCIDAIDSCNNTPSLTKLWIIFQFALSIYPFRQEFEKDIYDREWGSWTLHFLQESNNTRRKVIVPAAEYHFETIPHCHNLCVQWSSKSEIVFVISQ